jgi:hypothetical protein
MSGGPVQVLFTAALLLTGCATQSGFGRARVLPEDTGELGGLVQGTLTSVKLGPGDPVPLPWVQLGLGYHEGLGGGLEVGGRLWVSSLLSATTFGVAADAKYQLDQASGPTDRFDLAVGASLSYQRDTLGGWPWHGATLAVPLLCGWNLGRHQLVFGPRVGAAFGTSQGQNPLLLGYGGLSLAFAAQLTERLTFTPELVLLYSPVSFNGTLDDPERKGASLLELGFGLDYQW